MNKRKLLGLALAGAGLMWALAGPAQAQKTEEEPSFDRLLGLVNAAMPPVIGDSNTGLVANLLGVELGPQISRTFDFAKARSAVFGRVAPNLAPDCGRTGTAVGDPDQGECTAFVGNERGGEAYRSLSFSKNLGVGNIRFLSRPRAVDLKPTDLKPVDLANADVYDRARKFLSESFGLPLSELPPIRGDRLPVKDLSIGFDKESKLAPIVVQKVVYLRRALKLPQPLVDPQTKNELTHIPAPGDARVAFGPDGLPISAAIRWQELRKSAHVDPKNAKSRSALVQEIAQDLRSEGGHVGIIAILIGLAAEPRGTHGLLLPAVQVFVSPGGRDTEPPGPTTGAYVKEYSLVDFREAALER